MQCSYMYRVVWHIRVYVILCVCGVCGGKCRIPLTWLMLLSTNRHTHTHAYTDAVAYQGLLCLVALCLSMMATFFFFIHHSYCVCVALCVCVCVCVHVRTCARARFVPYLVRLSMAMCVFNCLSFLPAHAPQLMHTQYSLEPSGKIRFRIQFKEHWGGKDY